MAPNTYPHLNPGACECYFIWQSFCRYDQLRILKWDFPNYPGGPWVPSQVSLWKRDQECRYRTQEKAMEMGTGAMGPEPKNVTATRSWKRQSMDAPLEASEEPDLMPCWVWGSGLQNCDRINLGCFKPQLCGNSLQQPREPNTPVQPPFPHLLNRNKICALLDCFDKINKCDILAQSVACGRHLVHSSCGPYNYLHYFVIWIEEYRPGILNPSPLF